MKENVLDVLLYLFEYYMADNPGQPLDSDRDTLESRLVEAGFSTAEIRKAFGWMDTLWQRRSLTPLALQHGRNVIPHDEALDETTDEGRESSVLVRPATLPSMRIFVGEELTRLDTDCRGFLLFLESVAILSPINRELVIERVLALPEEDMDLERLKWLVLLVLFTQPGEEEAYAWMEELIYDNLTGYMH
jgi:Smg protein